ncbi:MAG TPA: response regulator [Phycisphaerae bacterium]|jgi:two-component system KDP operon response regulator KdpE
MTESQPTILVIEDEEPIRKFLRAGLSAHGYRLIESSTGKDGLVQAASAQPDLIILDLGLPDMDGVDLTRQIREWSKIPIIIVSARGKEQDKVIALDAGADDYLTKPFGVGELLARLRVALRHRAVSLMDGESVFEIGDLKVDLARRQVSVAGNPVHLTPNEYRLLAILVKYAGRVLTHRQLLKEIWGPDSSQETHYLRVYMNQLRQKLEADPTQPRYLVTESGVGYRLMDA